MMVDKAERTKCDKCGKQFATISLVNRHKLKKIPCDVNAKKKYIENKNKCNFCGKISLTYKSAKYHANVCKKSPIDCNKKDNEINTANEIQNVVVQTIQNEEFEIMKNKLAELTRLIELKDEEIKEIKSKQTEETNKLWKEMQKMNKRKKNKINVTNNNNFINNVNNFNIIAYGKETCDHISDTMFKNIIRR